MGIWNKLTGENKPKPVRYVDEGMRITAELISSLRLEGWKDFLPEYTNEEIAAIQHELSMFQNLANREMGGEAVFHPEAVTEIQRKFTAQALQSLGDRGWKFGTDVPTSWKSNISTYMKAWASDLNPYTLINVGELLIRAGYKTEARRVLEVVLLFPNYAPRYYGDAERATRMASDLVTEAEKILATL